MRVPARHTRVRSTDPKSMRETSSVILTRTLPNEFENVKKNGTYTDVFATSQTARAT
jgi:hypothetical protein